MITAKTERYTTDWDKLIEPHELITRENGLKVVPLKVLQKLAYQAGLEWSDAEIRFIPASDTKCGGIMQCIYRTRFSDGTQWVGTSDCSSLNTSAEFMAHSTAVAESKAEARSLRKALGISMLAAEEINLSGSPGEVSPDEKIDTQVVKAINKLCEDKNISPADLLNEILGEKGATVFELGELTVKDGQAAMAWLNEQLEAKKTKTQERSERKKELLASQVKDDV